MMLALFNFTLAKVALYRTGLEQQYLRIGIDLSLYYLQSYKCFDSVSKIDFFTYYRYQHLLVSTVVQIVMKKTFENTFAN